MIPNLDQLLIVCGIALAFVAGIVWLLIKLPVDDGEPEQTKPSQHSGLPDEQSKE
ncbi:hypothetical protein ACFO4O_00885 [Glaciecola siphonariae]|uniref:Uncharacterized protein n=1 Tax=Glaciecola siphonariae TaxID=521012 RepID=A0ABV9LR67_9ALTE